jgi:hypothetical protein
MLDLFLRRAKSLVGANIVVFLTPKVMQKPFLPFFGIRTIIIEHIISLKAESAPRKQNALENSFYSWQMSKKMRGKLPCLS